MAVTRNVTHTLKYYLNIQQKFEGYGKTRRSRNKIIGLIDVLG